MESLSEKSVFALRNVRQSKGGQTILDGVNLEIETGKITALVGPSGAGKTSLLRLLNRLDEPTGGEIFYRSRPIAEFPVQKLRRQIGFVFQTPVMFPGTIADNLRAALEFGGKIAADADELIAETLRLAEIDATLFGRDGAQLSVGQKQRVSIARALMSAPEVLLLDEPTSALDPELRHEVLKVMQLLAEEGMTMIVVTHEMEFARQVGSRLIFMEGGHIVHDGDPRVLIGDPPSARFRDFIRHVS